MAGYHAALAIHPGWVQTDLGNGGAQANGLPSAPYTLETSVSGIMSRIDGATREKSGGKFWNATPNSGGMPWDIPTDEIKW